MKTKYLSCLPIVMLMMLIFFFSSKQADDSNHSSLNIANKIFQTIETIRNQQFEGEYQARILEIINFIVRKSAHFSEYALLAIAIGVHVLTMSQGKKRFKLFLAPIAYSALYACTDEYHQTFVFGRSGQFSDVLIDTVGAFFGTMVFLLVFGFCLRIAQKKKDITSML